MRGISWGVGVGIGLGGVAIIVGLESGFIFFPIRTQKSAIRIDTENYLNISMF